MSQPDTPDLRSYAKLEKDMRAAVTLLEATARDLFRFAATTRPEGPLRKDLRQIAGILSREAARFRHWIGEP